MRRTWFSILLLFAVTFAAYAPALRNSFVWDDTALVLRDPLIRSWRLAPDGFREFLFLDATASDFYRPLQRLTFTADYALWGIARDVGEKTGAPETGDHADVAAIQRAPQPGWHFTSVFVHALSAVALWMLLRSWLGGGVWPMLGALAWAVHPLHTSAVTYVSGRADPLAALFVFSALALVVRAHKNGGLSKGDRPASWCVMGAGLCALAALLSKESGIAALALWLVWLLAKARRDKRAWLAWAGCAAIVLSGYLALRGLADRTPVPPSKEPTPWSVRPILAARALAEYTTLFVAPHSLHMERDISTRPMGDGATTLRWARWREAQTLAGCLIAIGLALWARWAMRRSPDAAVALACFVATWLPVSNFISLNATVAEHWLYVPSAFLIAAIAFTFRDRCPPRLAITAAAMWMLFLAVQTARQQDYWRDQQTFVTQTAGRAGRGVRMLVNLGQLAAVAGRDDEALRLYREALNIEPDLAVAHFNVATMALRQKDYAVALDELSKAESSPLFKADAIVIRAAIAEAQSGQSQIKLLADAADAAPRNWSICRRLPLTLAAIGKLERAYADILRHNNIRPYRGEAWRLLGQIAEKLGQSAVAARAYGEAANCDSRDSYSRERMRALRSSL